MPHHFSKNLHVHPSLHSCHFCKVFFDEVTKGVHTWWPVQRQHPEPDTRVVPVKDNSGKYSLFQLEGKLNRFLNQATWNTWHLLEICTFLDESVTAMTSVHYTGLTNTMFTRRKTLYLASLWVNIGHGVFPPVLIKWLLLLALLGLWVVVLIHTVLQQSQR